ncbi:cephalosporin hydroxylase [Sulfitobacter sp. SK012]|uniref:cephalosporin hydroxylase family protein n=1 Tax=Sulfitobacter sp. SK012 TaxID=1389005 RepID=UPI000E0AD4DC|nr:CmcI family methyltransferase [Sulfitobacter sp. SK012]AXI48173.1 cephalosporin hydroxylase [Sulfitobacter sp. SK012]
MPNQDPIAQFEKERSARIEGYKGKDSWNGSSAQWMDHAFREHYMYNFAWAGRPIIQLPADIVGFQELVYKTRPDVIFETGIAHGGSLMLSASLLAMLDVCDALAEGRAFDPAKSHRKVIGIDIDIRQHNRDAIEAHPLSAYVDMVEGSSTETDTAERAKALIPSGSKVLVALDSNHTEDHVIKELELYSPLTSKGSYCIVYDTIVEDLAEDMFPNRPWAPGNNPKTALRKFMTRLDGGGVKAADGDTLAFELDREMDGKLLLSVCPEGILARK